MHVFSTLPRNANFIEHTSRLGWKDDCGMIVDPRLGHLLFYASTRRELPTAFKLHTGSLTRDLAEYVVRCTLLMYYANLVSSPEGYFQTVLCNAPRLVVPTVANHDDLHHIQWEWDVPPRQHPHALTLGDMGRMVRSDARRPGARRHRRPAVERARHGSGKAAAGMFERRE
nr:LOW QUALITY PROTEIN: beta-glucuronosyltransferase GlcAT14A-like [Aegilops tauschii subsp. strangulata]